MKKGKASWTAQGVTFFRAIESMRPERERACYDPLAREFLNTGFKLVCRSRIRTRIAWRYILSGRHGRSAHYCIARTGYIDDCLKRCVDGGIEQLVILGAGYDSRAYRFDELRGDVQVFEVDHPATQKRKLKRVRKIFGSLPGHVTYVPVDFVREKLAERLLACGYDPGLRTLFIWEGVTMYLTPEAVDETLCFIAENSGDGSRVVFDYVFKSVLDGEIEGARAWREYLERRGEPPLFGIEEGEVGEFLSARGFELVEDVTGAALTRACFEKVGGLRGPLRATPERGGICATVKY